MRNKWVLASSVVVALAAAIGVLWFAHAAQAGPPAQLSTQSGAPGLISYQGYLTDSAGDPVADGSYDLTFELCDAQDCSNVLWSESYSGTSSVTIQDGYLAVMLGSQTPLSVAHFGDQTCWLRISAKAVAESTYTVFPAQQIAAVPYALNAAFGVQRSGTSAGNGLTIVNSGSGTAIVGTNNGTGYGVIGSSAGTAGVYGLGGVPSGFAPSGAIGAWGDSSDSYGVVGSTSDNNAAGVFGMANESTAGNTYGVYGWSMSPDGAGVYGLGDDGVGTWGMSSNGIGGRFDSVAGHALVVDGPSLDYGLTPKQIGMLRWYEAVSSTHTAVALSSDPREAAFDGDHIWVADANNHQVLKVRASDGTILNTYATSSCTPNGVTYDGLYLWLGCMSGHVQQMRASDGFISNTLSIPMGSRPGVVAFDGTYVWAADTSDPYLTRIWAANPSISQTYTLDQSGTGFTQIAFDGTYLWLPRPFNQQVYRVLAANPAISTTFATGTNPFDVVFDGANVWIPNNASGEITCLRAVDGALIRTLNVGGYPETAVFDGAHIWVAEGDALIKIRAVDGSIVGRYPTPAGYFSDVVFDGANVWVINSTTDAMYKH